MDNLVPNDLSLEPKGAPSERGRLHGPVWSIVFALGLIASSGGLAHALFIGLGGTQSGTLTILSAALSGAVGLASLSYFFALAPWGRKMRRQTRLDTVREIAGGQSIAAALSDETGALLWTNGASADLLGGSGRLTFAQGHGRSKAAQALIAECLAAGASAGEVVLTDPNGLERYCTAHLRILALRPVALFWQFTDNTELADLRTRSFSILDQVGGYLDGAAIGYYTAGPDGTIKYANATFAAWCGSTASEIMAEAPSLAELFDQITTLNSRGTQNTEAPLRGMLLKPRGAAPFPVQVTSQVLGLSGTEERETHALVLDLRKEQRWQDALGEATTRFEQFLNDAPISIVLVHKSGAITGSNGRFQAMLSGADGDQQGRLFTDLIFEPDRTEVQAYLDRTLVSETNQGRIDVRLGDSGDTMAQLYASQISTDGTSPGLILYLVDTTDQKNLEMQFAQSQKMQAVGQLAGGVAHDFNNLLTAIIGFCDLLLMRHKAGDPSFADVMQVKQNANRAANLTRQLLAFSRQQTLRPKVLVVTDTLAELSNLLRRLIGETITLEMRHGREIGAVKVDQGQLEQVIINLAVNARDAMPEGGSLRITTKNIGPADVVKLHSTLMQPDDYVLIEVKDSGVGIPQEILGKIFEPFFTTKDVGQGTGLGLSTVYGIIKQTGGFIFADSEMGRGTTFNIYLPVYKGDTGEDSEAAPCGAADVAKDLTGKGTILLVEDEDAVRTFASRALTNKGYHVLEASNGQVALEYINDPSTKIDLLLSDVVMPEMDGPTLANIATDKRPDMKIIFISGYAEDAFRDKVSGDNLSFLPKPFSLTQLAARVKEVMQG